MSNQIRLKSLRKGNDLATMIDISLHHAVRNARSRRVVIVRCQMNKHDTQCVIIKLNLL